MPKKFDDCTTKSLEFREQPDYLSRRENFLYNQNILPMTPAKQAGQNRDALLRTLIAREKAINKQIAAASTPTARLDLVRERCVVLEEIAALSH